MNGSGFTLRHTAPSPHVGLFWGGSCSTSTLIVPPPRARSQAPCSFLPMEAGAEGLGCLMHAHTSTGGPTPLQCYLALAAHPPLLPVSSQLNPAPFCTPILGWGGAESLLHPITCPTTQRSTQLGQGAAGGPILHPPPGGVPTILIASQVHLNGHRE